MFSFIKRHKALSLLLFLNVVAVLLAILIIVIHNSKTVTIDVMVAPREAVVELNGAKYENLQSHNVAPGEYHVVLSMEGMQTKEFDLSLTDGNFVRIWDYLLDAEGGFSYYIAHPEDVAILESVADDEAKVWLEEYNKVWGIVNILPIKYDSFTPDYAYYTQYEIVLDSREDCPKILCLKIVDGTGGNEQAAIDKIKENGFNPDDYEIKYEYDSIYSVRVGNE